MKNVIKHITCCALLLTGAGMGLSSCEDFLTITPTDKIVEEDFWKDRNDLNSAMMACYKRMVDNDLLCKYVYWGEERSDNFMRSGSESASGEVANIMNANLLPTYGQFSWTPMYNAINHCNKILAHGKEVMEQDESFSENDWKPIHAEAITLRALCHFYLVRTFGEIPYVTEDYNNDSQELRTPQSTQLTVLNNIIDDLESIKDDAMVDYGNIVENKGRITKKAVYALLADVYLWRASYKAGGNQPFRKIILSNNYTGSFTEEELASRHEEYNTTAKYDYEKCIEYCDLVISMAKADKQESIKTSGLNTNGTDIALELEDLLASNEPAINRKSYLRTTANAYNVIFGTGNSEESIFELQVDGTSYSNSMITSLFYNIRGSKAGSFTGTEDLFSTVETNPNSMASGAVFTKTDYRRWESILHRTQQTSYDFCKYINLSMEQTNSPSNYLTDNTSEKLSESSTTRSSSNVNANWIVYRLSEIFLMKAEAMSQLYDDEDHLAEAFTYVRDVFKRSNPYAYQASNSDRAKDTLKFEGNFNSSEKMESLVLAERHREFICEGKRWFDLVRYALRRGNTADMLTILSRKYPNSNSIKAKLADMQSLYSPVYNKEIKNNSKLYQNGVWSVNETSERNN